MTHLETLDATRLGREAVQLESSLRKRIVGQDEAIEGIVNVYQSFLTGMTSPGRPAGTFLFLGPTGSGKTRTVEALAESLTGDARAVIKIDCAEYQHGHEIAKLVGSPPGYLGHRETLPLLSQQALNRYHTETLKLSFVLFDEIEKGSDALWKLLLGILDKAILTTGDNHVVDFSCSMIFLTSNLGAQEMASLLRPGFGFKRQEQPPIDERLGAKLSRVGVEAARRKFTPEFLNRIDRMVTFKALGESELRQVLGMELEAVQNRITSALGSGSVKLSLTERARDFVLGEGTDQRYGARHLKRAVERLVVHPMSNLIATRQIQEHDTIIADLHRDQTKLMFQRVADEPTAALAKAA
jgi:ATP-dependent Clp protease ATP-binding subunit ClpA